MLLLTEQLGGSYKPLNGVKQGLRNSLLRTFLLLLFQQNQLNHLQSSGGKISYFKVQKIRCLKRKMNEMKRENTTTKVRIKEPGVDSSWIPPGQ